MRNSISIASISGFFFGLVGLPLIKILGLWLVCKIILSFGVTHYMVGVAVIAVIFFIIVFSDFGKKEVPQKRSEASKSFLNGSTLGVIVLFVCLVLIATGMMNELSVNLADLF